MAWLTWSYSYITFPFPFCCAAQHQRALQQSREHERALQQSISAAAEQNKTTMPIVFGQPLPGLLACYSAFCLLCRPAKLMSSGGWNGRFILKNCAHWEYDRDATVFLPMPDGRSRLGVDYTCVLDVQFGCAANRLLQWLAFSMCSKIRDQLHWMQQTLQQAVQRDVALHKCDITLHAALRAFLSTPVKKQVGKRKWHKKRMQRCMQHGVQRGVAFLR
jgi:hypothetical protein